MCSAVTIHTQDDIKRASTKIEDLGVEISRLASVEVSS